MQTNNKNGNRERGDSRDHKNPFMNASAFIHRIAALALPIEFNAWGQSLTAPFTRLTTRPWTESARSVSVAACDYNNDGWPDLFVGHHGTASALYRNYHGTNFIKVTTRPIATSLIGSAHAAAWADYGNGGFPDVYIACGSIYTPQPDAFCHNNGSSNSWIKIRCVGTISNRSAIGTTIRAKARIGGTDRWQMRQIVGTEGWLSFNDLDQIIGLGDATVVDTHRMGNGEVDRAWAVSMLDTAERMIPSVQGLLQASSQDHCKVLPVFLL